MERDDASEFVASAPRRDPIDAQELLPRGQEYATVGHLYRGIAGRNFERRFQLADHVKVVGAKLANGLLTIELQREIPEEKKPRTIAIQADASKPALTH